MSGWSHLFLDNNPASAPENEQPGLRPIRATSWRAQLPNPGDIISACINPLVTRVGIYVGGDEVVYMKPTPAGKTFRVIQESVSSFSECGVVSVENLWIAANKPANFRLQRAQSLLARGIQSVDPDAPILFIRCVCGHIGTKELFVPSNNDGARMLRESSYLIVGGAIGAAFGGPLGLLIGSSIGWLLHNNDGKAT